MQPVMLSRGALRPWTANPRKKFKAGKLQELGDSMKAVGQLQNLIVRPLAEPVAGVTHEIILGERRWRASDKVGITELACVVRELTDKDAAAMCLMENINRDDLDVEEEAGGYKLMVTEGWDVKEIAEMTGKKSDYIYEMLDLLELDRATLKELADQTITRQTARALGRIDDLQQRQHALATVVNVGGAPMAQKLAKEVIKNNYLAKQKLQQKWADKRRKLEVAYPGATIIEPAQAHDYLGYGSKWVKTSEKPEHHELAKHVRNSEMEIPTWGELGRKHGAPVVVVPDNDANPVEMVEKGPLEAAERVLGEADPANCIFAIAGGQGRHQQTNAGQKAEEEKKKREKVERDQQEAELTSMLKHLRHCFLAPDGLSEEQINATALVMIDWLDAESFFPGVLELAEELGIDVATMGEGDDFAGAEMWVKELVKEFGLYGIAFLTLGAKLSQQAVGSERFRGVRDAIAKATGWNPASDPDDGGGAADEEE